MILNVVFGQIELYANSV